MKRCRWQPQSAAVDSRRQRSRPPLSTILLGASKKTSFTNCKNCYICGYILCDYCMSQIPPKNPTRPTKISQISSSWACGTGEVLSLWKKTCGIGRARGACLLPWLTDLLGVALIRVMLACRLNLGGELIFPPSKFVSLTWSTNPHHPHCTWS
jgi:hypothetical protein